MRTNLSPLLPAGLFPSLASQPIAHLVGVQDQSLVLPKEPSSSQETSVQNLLVCAKSFFVAAIVCLAAERLRSMRATRMAARLALPLCNQLDRVPGVDRSPCLKKVAARSNQLAALW